MYYKGNTVKNINASKQRTGWLYYVTYFVLKFYRKEKKTWKTTVAGLSLEGMMCRKNKHAEATLKQDTHARART